MSKEEKAYEHRTEMAGFGSEGEGKGKGNEHREATTPETERNELNVQERNRAPKDHGPETHQDTRITEAEGLKRLRREDPGSA